MHEHSQPPPPGLLAPPAALDPIGAFLNTPAGETHQAPAQLWGFGGLHGGLALAAMAGAMQTAMQTADATHPLRSITGRLFRTVRDPFNVDVTADSATRSTRAYSAHIQSASTEAAGAGALASATALFGAESGSGTAIFAPSAPTVPPWNDCTHFKPVPGFVPISEYTEIRPIGSNLPFTGGSVPALTAWVRIAEDDTPPDDLRLLFLTDALAPSYAAVLTVPCPVPTLELSVHFSGERATSPWVLIEARTTVATRGGWITETINAWSEDGAHLAEATQLRLVRPAQASTATTRR